MVPSFGFCVLVNSFFIFQLLWLSQNLSTESKTSKTIDVHLKFRHSTGNQAKCHKKRQSYSIPSSKSQPPSNLCLFSVFFKCFQIVMLFFSRVVNCDLWEDWSKMSYSVITEFEIYTMPLLMEKVSHWISCLKSLGSVVKVRASYFSGDREHK